MTKKQQQQQQQQPLALSLSPWKRTLGLMYAMGFTDRVRGVFGIRLNLRPPFENLREAMELLCLAVVLDPTVLYDLVERGWMKVHGVPITQKPSEDKLTELFRGGDSVVSQVAFTAPHDGFQVRSYQEALASILLINATKQTPRSGNQYLATRKTLMKRIKDQDLQSRLTQPVQISCLVNSLHSPTTRRAMDERFYFRCVALAAPLHVHDFFTQLTQLATHVREYRLSRTVATCVRFAVDHIELTLGTCFPITTCIVEKAKQLMAADDSGRVVCLELMLDPRLISCTPAELLAFTCVMSRGSPGLRIVTGYYGGSQLLPIDAGDEDRTELIVALMEAIAACDSLTSVDVGPLLYLLTKPTNRQCLWRMLVEVVLAPTITAPLQELQFRGHVELSAEDCSVINQLTHDGARSLREVRGLRCELWITTDHYVVTLLSLVRNLHTIAIDSKNSRQDLPAMAQIVQQHSTLRVVYLANVILDSMAVFSGLACLQSLELVMTRMKDRSSITVFLRLLADPSTRLAQTLHTLVMTSSAPRDTDYDLDSTAAELLKQALETSRTLHHVSVKLTADVPADVATALLSHNGDIVVVPDSTPENEARKTAFVSAIYAKAQARTPSAIAQLDAVLTRQIFALAAPFAERVVQINTPYARIVG